MICTCLSWSLTGTERVKQCGGRFAADEEVADGFAHGLQRWFGYDDEVARRLGLAVSCKPGDEFAHRDELAREVTPVVDVDVNIHKGVPQRLGVDDYDPGFNIVQSGRDERAVYCPGHELTLGDRGVVSRLVSSVELARSPAARTPRVKDPNSSRAAIRPLIRYWIKGLNCTYVGPRGIEPRTRGLKVDWIACNVCHVLSADSGQARWWAGWLSSADDWCRPVPRRPLPISLPSRT